MSTLLAVDLGTSYIKGAVLDMEALSIAHIRRVPFPEPLAGLPELFCEIDAMQVVQATRGLIAELLPHAPACAGIVACGQMGGLVLSGEDGAPRSNYISWRDQRLLTPHPSGAGTHWDHFLQRLGDADRRALGNEVRPGLPVSFLFWMVEQGRLPARPLVAASLPDFVLANLCGTRPATEPTNAAGAIDVETGDWHHDLFARLGFAHVGWPALCSVREPVGLMRAGGLALPCYAPAGDHQTALAGAFVEPGELSLNISTGSQAGLLSARLEPGSYQTRPFFDGMFLNTITHIPAGRSLNVLLGLLVELAEAQGVPLADPWPYIARAVEATPDTDLSIDLAFFPSPVGDRGAISHIHEGNLRVGPLFRAAFRAMAENYRTCASRLAPAQDWRRIVFSGGLARNLEVLRRLIVERFRCDYRLCASTEDSLLGLLVLGLVATGGARTAQAAMRRLSALPEPRWPL